MIEIRANGIKSTEGTRECVRKAYNSVILSETFSVSFSTIPLWKRYYHFVWATHDHLPLITPSREAPLYQYCHDKADALGAYLHAIGGIEDHVHLIVSIPPKLAVAEFVHLMKGSSCHYLNTSHPDPSCKFKWQQEYGVFSLGSKQLDFAIAYTQNQKHHHSNKTILRALEPEAIPSPAS